MNVGSLFSGIGGMDAGLAAAGHHHVFFCESDPWRREVLAARWPGVPVYDNVRNVAASGDDVHGRGDTARATLGSGTAGLTDAPGLLCGGFPCQDLSVAGKRAGLAGDRSGLFFEFARIIDAFRPGRILLENVPGLLSSNGGRDFGVVLGTLADLGYGVAWRVLDSRFFGVPQRRRRVFIVGARADGDPSAAAGRAGEVLAVGSRCPRHPPTGTDQGEDSAAPSVVSTLAGSGKSGGWRIGADEAAGGQLVANTLRSQERNTSQGPGNYVAAPLTKGSASGEGVNAPGRRQEDDVNIVAFHPTGGGAKGLSASEDVAPGTGTGTGAAGTIAIAYPISGDALRSGDAMTPSPDAEGRIRLRDPGLGVGDEGTPAFTPTKAHPGAVAYALNAKRGNRDDGESETFVSASSGVRRLTPVECERLQGLPDGWTQLDAKTPDSRRYSALGDAVTASAAEWIGSRLRIAHA